MNISRNINIKLHFHYALGKALNQFYQHLYTYGTFLEAICSTCQYTCLPPLLHCPKCLAQIEKWNELGPEVKLISYTTNADGITIGMFAFENSQGLFFHRVLVEDKEHVEEKSEMVPVICNEALKGFKPKHNL